MKGEPHSVMGAVLWKNMIFDETRKALDDYEKLWVESPKSDEEKYEITCAELDISKAFVYDIGYERAAKFAKGILALGELA